MDDPCASAACSTAPASGLQPGYVTTPLLAEGNDALPSTVDVFVQPARRLAGRRAGPFEITNVPAVSGSGSIQLVVRDAFGQQQVISQSFYGSPVRSAPGWTTRLQHGCTAPQLRDRGSTDGLQGSALWRRRRPTRSRPGPRPTSGALGRTAADFQVGRLGIGSAGIAASHGDAGSGAFSVAGLSARGRRFSAGVRAAVASERSARPATTPDRHRGATSPRTRDQPRDAGLVGGRTGVAAIQRPGALIDTGVLTVDRPGRGAR